MKFKKRYFFGFVFIAFLGCLYFGCFSMRTSNPDFEEQLLARGQVSPQFETYNQGDQKVHYVKVEEDPRETTVIFVHGSPGSSDNFLDYLGDTTFSDMATLVAVDRPGFGYSGFGKAVLELKAQSSALAPLLKKFQEQRVILVGYSLGGPVIVRMAIDYPELVDGLVMVAPSIDPELEGNTWWRKTLDWPLFSLLTPKALRTCNREIIPLKDELTKLIPYWSRITVPVTVIQGAKDKLVPAGNADFARRMLTNSTRVNVELLEGEGHFILWSKTEIVKSAIRDMVLSGQ